MTILRQDRQNILTDQWGRFRSLRLASPITPTVGPGDDGFLWLDIGVDGTPSAPVWKMWDESANTWRLVGIADASFAGVTDICDIALTESPGVGTTIPRGDHVHAHPVFASGDLHPEYMTPAEHTAIGNSAPHHAAMTLDANADTLLALAAQKLGLDTQSAGRFLGGPISGAAAVPTFRVLDVEDMPASTCAFLARPSADITDVTGDGTAYHVVFPSEIVDRGDDYDTATGTFTARKTGLYMLTGGLYLGGIISTHTAMLIAIVTSNRVYGVVYVNPYPIVVSTDRVIFGVSCLADMDAADTAYLRVTVTGGTKVVDIIYSSAYSCFGGFLLSE